MINGAHGKTRYDQNLFELKMGDVYASMSLRPGDGIDTFKCNCGYKGAGFCKHFIFLFSAASGVVADLENAPPEKVHISTLERKAARSKFVTPELKTLFKNFKKDFSRLWRVYIGSSNQRDAMQNLNNLYDARNKVMDACLDAAYKARTEKSLFASFEILLYGLFNFCKIMGYDNKEMLVGVTHHFAGQLNAVCRKAKAAEKRQMWDYLAKSLRVADADKLPENPILEIIIEFLTKNYTTDRYYNANLDLFDELIDYALENDDEYHLGIWAVEYLWLLEESDISGDDFYGECRRWWYIPQVRLNYLEHCMAAKDYLAAYTIATECLSDANENDDEEILTLHRILLGSSYKLGKYEKAIDEAKFLADNFPETIVFDLQHYLSADKTRWPKIKTEFRPILARAKRNLAKSKLRIKL